jgi:homoserine kinase type II
MAVYTEISDAELEGFVAAYDIGAVTGCKGIAEGVENSNYLLTTETGTFILTLYEKRVRVEDLPFFLGLMDHLAHKGVRCPTPLRGRDGLNLRALAGRQATIVTFLSGLWPRSPQTFHCAELGRALAGLHLAGEGFSITRANGLGLHAWRPLFQMSEADADKVKPGLADSLRRELDWLEANWPKGLPTGVIHADLFPDNVFFQGQKLSGLIDFYFACNDFLVYDIAVCLNAWCFEADGAFNVTKARHMLSSYRSVRAISSAEFDALPILARGAALRFLLTRLYDWINTPSNALVKRKDPLEYEKKLRFHASLTDPAGYGLDFFPAEAGQI